MNEKTKLRHNQLAGWSETERLRRATVWTDDGRRTRRMSILEGRVHVLRNTLRRKYINPSYPNRNQLTISPPTANIWTRKRKRKRKINHYPRTTIFAPRHSKQPPSAPRRRIQTSLRPPDHQSQWLLKQYVHDHRFAVGPVSVHRDGGMKQ